jgi:hypothetical protein
MDTAKPQPALTPTEKLKEGLRAIFSTTKEQSDAQLAEAADKRKKQRDKKTK